MKTKLIILSITFYLQFLFSNIISAQSILISPSAGVPDPSAGLEVRYTNKGMLLPRVALTSTSSASPITNPANGLMVYNTATVSDVQAGIYYWSNSKWNSINGTGTAASNMQYWDGANWVNVPQGTEGQYLMLSGSNIPSWTSMALPTLTTIAANSITSSSASSGGNITDDGGSRILARGVCWNTTGSPTTANSITSDGTGIEPYGSTITGLSAGTTYYVRAYAANSDGIAYGNEVSFTSIMGDCDGNTYDIVSIGSQVWMKQNLKTTKYRDGSAIPNVTNNTTWANLTTGAYCDYDNTSSNSDTYGRLYNWYAVNNAAGICPSGWHVPTHDEWTTLERAVCTSGSCATDFPFNTSTTGWRGTDEGGKLKESSTTYWCDNTGATNSSGFTGLAGGQRQTDGSFNFILGLGHWWSATEQNSPAAWERYLFCINSKVGRGYSSKASGNSIRCVKD